MHILKSTAELKALLSPIEVAAYLTDAWNGSEQLNMVTDEINMSFENPAQGKLIIKGGFKTGEQHFIIKCKSTFKSKLKSIEANDNSINRCLTLIGDAETGVITSMLIDGAIEHKDESREESSQLSDFDWTEIQNCLSATGDENVWRLQKEGFKAFSSGEVTIPPVIYMPFKGYGDLHLKGAHKNHGDIYVFKIATGFPGNVELGLQPSQGMMLAFDAITAKPLMVLRDEGHLTDLRTAIAGRNAAEEMMEADELIGIGVLGTGVQARLQITLLKNLYPHCNKLTVWGHTKANAVKYANEMTDNGWEVNIVDTPKQVAQSSNLIITTTPSEVALLEAADITYTNTLIIAIGADMPGKVELSADLLKKAASVLIDSISQGKDHGNAAVAIKDNVINESDLQEFGDFLINGYKDPQAKNQLRLFLSSGIGVQDLQIVQAVIEGC
jgi:ornithine cyclodeaminase